MGKRNELAILLLFIFNCSFSNGQTNPPTAAPTTTPGPKPVKDSKDFPRQAPFCIEHGADMLDEPSDLQNFAPIFEKHNKENKFVPVSPDKWRSPSGYIKNITLNRIHITATGYDGMEDDHPYRSFRNFFHVSIVAVSKGTGADGLQGLYVQANSAPLGIPIGEFVNNFDCGDCPDKYKPSELADYTAIIPCRFKAAASYVQPVIFSIGGKSIPKTPFYEAHFHFKYIDYPCFDVVYAQFLIIAVRKFKPKPLYEIFYSPLFKVNIEGVGAPFPMYYGFTPNQVMCHDPQLSIMNNWIPQKNQKAKIKYNNEFDECTYNNNLKNGNKIFNLGPGTCPPGPVACGQDSGERIITGKQWSSFREDYNVWSTPKGTEILCLDCGEWEDGIGPGTWDRPKVVEEIENVSLGDSYITQKPVIIEQILLPDDCAYNNETEVRDKFAKSKTGDRNPFRQACPESFETDLGTSGYKWGQNNIITLHTALLLFVWTVGSNALIYTARFLKEASFAEKGSGCFGIGKWMWEHLAFTYLNHTALIAGVMMMIFLDQEALCKLFDSKKETQDCLAFGTVHKIMGAIACLFYFMAYLTGWFRPKSKTLRNIIIYYHAGCGYLSKYIGLFSILTATHLFETKDVVWICLLEVSFIAFYALGTIVQKMMDNQMQFRVRQRKMFPVPEGIDTFSEPPYKNIRALLFPFMLIMHLFFYTFAAFNVWSEEIASRY